MNYKPRKMNDDYDVTRPLSNSLISYNTTMTNDRNLPQHTHMKRYWGNNKITLIIPNKINSQGNKTTNNLEHDQSYDE